MCDAQDIKKVTFLNVQAKSPLILWFHSKYEYTYQIKKILSTDFPYFSIFPPTAAAMFLKLIFQFESKLLS